MRTSRRGRASTTRTAAWVGSATITTEKTTGQCVFFFCFFVSVDSSWKFFSIDNNTIVVSNDNHSIGSKIIKHILVGQRSVKTQAVISSSSCHNGAVAGVATNRGHVCESELTVRTTTKTSKIDWICRFVSFRQAREKYISLGRQTKAHPLRFAPNHALRKTSKNNNKIIPVSPHKFQNKSKLKTALPTTDEL